MTAGARKLSRRTRVKYDTPAVRGKLRYDFASALCPASPSRKDTEDTRYRRGRHCFFLSAA